jgi:hypothetical protein
VAEYALRAEFGSRQGRQAAKKGRKKKILPGTASEHGLPGAGQRSERGGQSLTEGCERQRALRPARFARDPSTTLRAVPLPVPGRNLLLKLALLERQNVGL